MHPRIDAADILLAIALLAAGGTLLYGARLIPPPFFDPVGSAALPRAVAWVLFGLLAAHLGLRLAGMQPRAPIRWPELGMGGGAVLSFVLVCIYCAVMQMRWLDFAPASAGFLALLITLLAGRWQMLPVAVLIGLAFGYGCQWLFTDVFFVDLPRARSR